MSDLQKNHAFANNIVLRLEAMHGVQLDTTDKTTLSLVKDEVKFGEISSAKLKLLKNNGKYKIIEDLVLSNQDLLLKEATNSYWIASGKK